jgi:hypothetical protein
VAKALLGAFIDGPFRDRDIYFNLHGNPIVLDCRQKCSCRKPTGFSQLHKLRQSRRISLKPNRLKANGFTMQPAPVSMSVCPA